MTTATDTDLQQVKDLITTLHAATQKQIADGNAAIQKQITDLAIQMVKLEQRVEVGFAKLEGDIKNLDTKFDEKTKNLDLRITNKEFANRGVTVGLTVAVVGGLLLAFGKLLFFGKI
jgi:hypothetical protein